MYHYIYIHLYYTISYYILNYIGQFSEPLKFIEFGEADLPFPHFRVY